MQFAVGLKANGKSEHTVMDAEDALVAAKKGQIAEAGGRDHVCASREQARRRAASRACTQEGPIADAT